MGPGLTHMGHNLTSMGLKLPSFSFLAAVEAEKAICPFLGGPVLPPGGSLGGTTDTKELWSHWVITYVIHLPSFRFLTAVEAKIAILPLPRCASAAPRGV